MIVFKPTFKNVSLTIASIIVGSVLVFLVSVVAYDLIIRFVTRGSSGSTTMTVSEYVAAQKICKDNDLEPYDVVTGSYGVTAVNCTTKSGGYVAVVPAKAASR